MNSFRLSIQPFRETLRNKRKNNIKHFRGCAHSHPYHDKQILKRVKNGNLFTQYKVAETVAMLNKRTASTGKKSEQED